MFKMFGRFFLFLFSFLKKNFRIILIIVLIGTAIGFFYWWEFWETPIEKWIRGEYKTADTKDFVINKTDEVITIVNKKMGIFLEIPKEWTSDGKCLIFDPKSDICFYSKEVPVEIKTDREKATKAEFYPQERANLRIEVGYVKIKTKTLESALRKTSPDGSVLSNSYQYIKIDNRNALLHTIEIKLKISKFNTYVMEIFIPTKTKLFSIIFVSPLDEKDKYLEEINKILETIKIRSL